MSTTCSCSLCALLLSNVIMGSIVEHCRLQDLLKSVYGERSRLRKKMAELDASERETLLKITRKVRNIHMWFYRF